MSSKRLPPKGGTAFNRTPIPPKLPIKAPLPDVTQDVVVFSSGGQLAPEETVKPTLVGGPETDLTFFEGNREKYGQGPPEEEMPVSEHTSVTISAGEGQIERSSAGITGSPFISPESIAEDRRINDAGIAEWNYIKNAVENASRGIIDPNITAEQLAKYFGVSPDKAMDIYLSYAKYYQKQQDELKAQQQQINVPDGEDRTGLILGGILVLGLLYAGTR